MELEMRPAYFAKRLERQQAQKRPELRTQRAVEPIDEGHLFLLF
jgi:hypothetical protein